MSEKYLMLLMSRFDQYEPSQLVDGIIKNPGAEEAVFDYVESGLCHPEYVEAFVTELKVAREDDKLNGLTRVLSFLDSCPGSSE